MDEENEDKRSKTRGRPRGKARGRPRNQVKIMKNRRKITSDDDEEEQPKETEIIPTFDKDCDISCLEAPTFTTLERPTSAPTQLLKWDHPVSLIGEKVVSPRIHACDQCNKPILIYGRMIPCKHVFCLWCARLSPNRCFRCNQSADRVEQTSLGTVFMCNFNVKENPCKRTYLSQRDLQAHIDHRHTKTAKEETRPPLPHPLPPLPRDPRGVNLSAPPPNFTPQNNQTTQSPIPVMTSSRTNLITVPLQEEYKDYKEYPVPPPIMGFSSPPPPFQPSQPPPNFNWGMSHPPPNLPPNHQSMNQGHLQPQQMAQSHQINQCHVTQGQIPQGHITQGQGGHLPQGHLNHPRMHQPPPPTTQGLPYYR